GIDVYALTPAHVRQIAPLEVGLEPMARDVRDSFDTVERPPPALVRMEAQIVQAPMDGIRRSIQIACKLGARKQPDAFAQGPVLEVAPGLPASADVDAGGRPGLSEGLEVAEYGIQRRIRASGTGAAGLPTMSTGETVPVLGRRRRETVILVEAPKPDDHALPC